jgi:hypothetical protein
MVIQVVESVGFAFNRCKRANELLLCSISDKRLVCLVNLASLLCVSYKKKRTRYYDSDWGLGKVMHMSHSDDTILLSNYTKIKQILLFTVLDGFKQYLQKSY